MSLWAPGPRAVTPAPSTAMTAYDPSFPSSESRVHEVSGTYRTQAASRSRESG
jgi:hypothetical protein